MQQGRLSSKIASDEAKGRQDLTRQMLAAFERAYEKILADGTAPGSTNDDPEGSHPVGPGRGEKPSRLPRGAKGRNSALHARLQSAIHRQPSRTGLPHGQGQAEDLRHLPFRAWSKGPGEFARIRARVLTAREQNRSILYALPTAVKGKALAPAFPDLS